MSVLLTQLAAVRATRTLTLPRLPCGAVRTLVDMEGSYLSANFFREIVAAESFSYDPSRPKPQFVTLTGKQDLHTCRHSSCCFGYATLSGR